MACALCELWAVLLRAMTGAFMTPICIDLIGNILPWKQVKLILESLGGIAQTDCSCAAMLEPAVPSHWAYGISWQPPCSRLLSRGNIPDANSIGSASIEMRQHNKWLRMTITILR